jgi:hypothetical protein
MSLTVSVEQEQADKTANTAKTQETSLFRITAPFYVIYYND